VAAAARAERRLDDAEVDGAIPHEREVPAEGQARAPGAAGPHRQVPPDERVSELARIDL
jgi:hypothetical protein